MTRRYWPSSLGGRTALVLLLSLTVVQVAGLTIHALDRIDVIRLAQVRDVAVRAISLYRSVTLSDPEQRAAVVKEFDDRDDSDARLDMAPPTPDLPPVEPDLLRQLRVNMALVPMPAGDRPKDNIWFGGPDVGTVVAGLKLPDGRWLNMTIFMPPPRPWHSPAFLAAFLLMTLAAGGLTLWAVRRLTAPVATLAAAADRLGRDVNAAPLPEDGPTEVATAAAAFNIMAGRMRRLLQDRSFMLAAIGHDLRTPITRLKLRAEFMEDDEQRRKMLSDLDELEAMVSAALSLGRDTSIDEPPSEVDLVSLVRTVLDETADTRPEAAEKLTYCGPDHLTVRARPFALKRALTNVVSNAVKYGGSAAVTLDGPDPLGEAAGSAQVTLTVEDDGPGIPPDDVERLFQPFQRLEPSRNRDTGGMGLGLTITRNILRAHGGEATIGNRPGGGARATMTLPA
jgi:signal transduction histidine kinase